MTQENELQKFGTIMTGDPARGFETILKDLFKRLRQQGVQQHSLDGVSIAMHIAYRLGERAGLQAWKPPAS
jgi:adenylylsulfate kinase-like enzyme